MNGVERCVKCDRGVCRSIETCAVFVAVKDQLAVVNTLRSRSWLVRLFSAHRLLMESAKLNDLSAALMRRPVESR